MVEMAGLSERKEMEGKVRCKYRFLLLGLGWRSQNCAGKFSGSFRKSRIIWGLSENSVDDRFDPCTKIGKVFGVWDELFQLLDKFLQPLGNKTF